MGADREVLEGVVVHGVFIFGTAAELPDTLTPGVFTPWRDKAVAAAAALRAGDIEVAPHAIAAGVPEADTEPHPWRRFGRVRTVDPFPLTRFSLVHDAASPCDHPSRSALFRGHQIFNDPETSNTVVRTSLLIHGVVFSSSATVTASHRT